MEDRIIQLIQVILASIGTAGYIGALIVGRRLNKNLARIIRLERILDSHGIYE